MSSKILGLFGLSILATLLFISGVSAVTLADWPLTSDGSATNVNANVTAGGFTNSSGISAVAFGTSGAYSSGWTTGSSINSSDYFQVTLAPKSGYNLTLSAISFNYSRSNTGPLNYTLQWSKNSDFSSPTTISTGFPDNVTEQEDEVTGLSISLNDSETVYFRWFAYNANQSEGTFRVKALSVEGTLTEVPVPEEELSFCDSGTINDSDLILKVDIDNKGEGEDNEWLPLDTIEVKVELENDKNIDLDDVIFEIGLFEEGSDTNIIDDMIWISDEDEEFEFGDIDENDDGKHTFEFRIDPNEVDSEDYLLMVKAYPQGEEDETCIDYSSDIGDDEFGASEYYAEIEITKETDRDKQVVIDEHSIELLEAACGQQVVLSLDVWNIGNRDYEDQIMVSLYNTELGINLREVVLGDLDEGDKTEVSFLFNVPMNAEEGTHILFMRSYYDYDEGDGKYEIDYDRVSEETFHVLLSVEGNCVEITEVTASISATLESEAKAGQELIVKAIITNTGNETVTYLANAAGYADWASAATLVPTSFTLAQGESEEVLFTFDVKSGVSGEKTFNIELVSEGQFILSQPVLVIIEEEAGWGGITGEFIRENKYTWGLGILNIILIIIIIIVAIRVARK